MSVGSGDSLYLPIMDGKTAHLWVVLTDADASGNVLAVNFTSFAPDKDITVTLDVGDHPYLTRKSIVSYQDAQKLNVPALEEGLKTGLVQRRQPCPLETLEKIRKGLPVSPFSPNGMITYLSEQLQQ